MLATLIILAALGQPRGIPPQPIWTRVPPRAVTVYRYTGPLHVPIPTVRMYWPARTMIHHRISVPRR